MELNLTTLLFESINFLVLLWLLSRVLYRPLRHALEERERALAAQRRAAREALSEAESLKESWEKKNAALDALSERVRAEALEDAVKERGRMLAAAQEEASAERVKAKKLLQAERDAAARWVQAMAIQRSTELAGELLLTLAPGALDRALGSRLQEEVGRRAEALRASLGGLPEGSPAEVEVVGAKIPSQDALGGLRDAITGALGGPVRLTVREDPTLRAGLVLRIGDTVLDASIAGQLDAFRELARATMEGGPHA